MADNKSNPLLNKTPFGAPRKDLSKALREDKKDEGYLHRFNPKERAMLEKNLFPPDKYGAYISPLEMQRKIKELERQHFRESNPLKKAEIKDTIELLKRRMQ